MGKLTTFLYAYLTGKANDPDCSEWLPKALEQYMPLTRNQAQELDVSSIQDTISDQLSITYQNIVNIATKGDSEMQSRVNNEVLFSCDLDDKEATAFSVSDITVYGINNLLIERLTSAKGLDDGYQMVFSVDGPEYALSEHKELEAFRVTLDFCLEQKLCAYLAEKMPAHELAEDIHVETYLPGNWPKCDLIIHGSMEITLKEGAQKPIVVCSDVTFTTDPKSEKRTIGAWLNQMAIQNVSFVNGAVFAPMNVKSTLADYDEKHIVPFVNYLVSIPHVRDGVIQSVNDTINEKQSDLSGQLTGFTGKMFNRVLGSVKDDILPYTKDREENPVDQYILDRIRYAMCNEKSKYYLPTVISTWKTPYLDDLSLGTIDLGSMGKGDADDFKVKKFLLEKVEMTKLSKLHVDLDNIGFSIGKPGMQDTATMLALLNPELFGNLNIITCTGSITGTFTIKLNDCPFFLACVISGEDVDTLTVDIKTSEIRYKPGTVTVSLTIDSLLKDLLEEMINTDDVLAMLVEKVNENLVTYQADLSKNATQKIREALHKADA